MRSHLLSILAVSAFCVAFASVAHAQIIYTSRTSFNAVAPGLTLETFEEAVIAPGTGDIFNAPLSSTSHNVGALSGNVLFPNGIVPGITIADSSFDFLGLAVAGQGFVAGTSKAVGNNIFGHAFDLTFAPSVNAVGFNLYTLSTQGGGPIGNYSIVVSVFGSNGLLTSTTVTGNGSPSFFGITSSSIPITRINLAGGQVKFVDDIAFGTSAAVPEPGSLALLVGLSISSAGVLVRQRRNRRFSRALARDAV